jgi:hypothetical protein
MIFKKSAPMIFRKLFLAIGLFGFGIIGSAHALTPDQNDNDNRNNAFQVIPQVFVGNAAQCGGVAGSNIVTSAWLPGMGLPDNGSSNVTPSNRDPHLGLLMNKNGLTADCSSALAVINGVNGKVLTELGFDYRNGSHCGAGAPRFNVVTSDNVFHFGGGCANGTKTPAPQDPAQWTRVRINPTNPAQMFPPVAPGATIKSIQIVFDEGTDTPSLDDPMGVGLVVLDNIDVNGALVGSGQGIAPNVNKQNNNDNNDNDVNDDNNHGGHDR